MKKKVFDIAKECGISHKELMTFLREKSINVLSGNDYIENNEIETVYGFYGVPKSVKELREKDAEALKAGKRILYDEYGKPIKRKRDENGKLIPITGKVYDVYGKELVMRKQYFDANGKPIKIKHDENGKPIPFEGPVFDENGKQVVLKRKGEAEPKAAKEPKNNAPEKKSPTPVEEPEKKESEAPKTETPAVEAPVKRENVYRNRALKQEMAEKENRDNKEKTFNKDKKEFNRGDRPDFKKKDGNFEKRKPNDGGNGFKKDFKNNNNKDGKPAFNKGGFDKGAFDKDKDAPEKRTFAKKNDNRSASNSIKSELSKNISRDQRAAAFNERKKDKNNKNKNRDFENEDGLKKPKKKDPNRKGAFIMPKPVQKVEEDPNEIKTVIIPEVVTLKDLADRMKQNASVIVKKLFMQGKMVSINSEISFEEAEEIALEYNYLVEKEVKVDVVEELMKDTVEDTDDELTERPPVVCVMGHVDHGKTSILDAIRESNVTSREAGGITQHIGAYMVEIGGRKITFLDTPGHEAFTAMRLRGAMATDIAVLVVAADDGVMPQTVEAISHAKAAGVSIVVAINKMDKEGANPDKVKTALSEYDLIPEEWGGNTPMVPVSAKKGEGINDLLEMILLTADVLELKANANRNARGLVVEAKLDKGRGPVATVLVKKGTLNVGDNIAIGATYGKVRAMLNDKGEQVKKAIPSTPVEILGLNGVPNSGDEFVVTKTDKEARTIAEAFIAQSKEKLLAETKAKLSLDGLFDQIQAGNVKELNVIVKADVQGSVEAVKQSLVKLSDDEVAVRVIHSGAGNVNESDVVLASASNAIIIGFNTKIENSAKETAEKEKVDVRFYSVIYNAIDDIEAAMSGMLDPIYEEKVIAHAEIRQIFKASGVGNIAGSYVLDGKVVKNSKARIFRKDEKIFEGDLASLKRFKDDVKEVAAGYECGFVFEKFSDVAEGDTVEFYILEEVPRNREKKQH